ncbi:hypothetical protein LXA43DRAFT_1067602 [Ganoderma leucocontextum]|nr:hypothetical protein LXA43DRAFT_1067602 [Ganoderma leucocontextum]
MSTISVAKPPATSQQSDLARILSSKLHYAFHSRPPLGSSSRAGWAHRFQGDVAALINLLNSARFNSLPSLAVGCVWENNCRVRIVPLLATLNIEAIRPVQAGHPALAETLPRGMKRLKYTATDSGAMGLLPEHGLPDRWWGAFSATASTSGAQDGSTMPSGGEVGQDRDQTGGQGSPEVTDDATEGQRMGSSSAPAPDVQQGGEESFMDVDEESALTAGRAAVESVALAALARIRPETIPSDWFLHPTPCERCVAMAQHCYIHPLSSSVCSFCARRKQKCSLTFTVTTQALSGFLAWAYIQMVSQPDVFGAPPFSPASCPIDAWEVPDWFQTQFVGKGKKPPYPDTQEIPSPSVSTAVRRGAPPSADSNSRSTRSAKGKEIATSSAPPTRTHSPAGESGRPSTRASTAAGRTPPTAAADREPVPLPQAKHRPHALPLEVAVSSAPPTRTQSPAEESGRSSTVAPTAAGRAPLLHAATAAGDREAVLLQPAKPRSKSVAPSTSRASSVATSATRREATALPSDVTAATAAAGDTEGRPIDVDAMEVDGKPTSPARGAHPRDQPHWLPALVVRGSEFDRTTAGDDGEAQPPLDQPDSPSGLGDFRVPVVPGSWRDLPRFEPSSAGPPRAQPEPHGDAPSDDPWPASLAALQNLAVEEDTRPQSELLKTALFLIAGVCKTACSWSDVLKKQAKFVKERSTKRLEESKGRTREEVLDLWVREVYALGDDMESITFQLADTNRWIVVMADALKEALSLPLHGENLEGMLGEVSRLRGAYEDASATFAALQEDVRPLRREIHRLRYRVDAADARVEVAASEAAFAVEPLLHNLHLQVSAEIEAVRDCVSKPLERLAGAIAQQGGLSHAILGDLVGGIHAALAEMWRSTAAIRTYVKELWHAASTSLSARVDDMEARLRLLEGVAPGPSAVDGAHPSTAELARRINSLADRIQALELQAEDTAAFDRRVAEALVRMGFTGDALQQASTSGNMFPSDSDALR